MKYITWYKVLGSTIQNNGAWMQVGGAWIHAHGAAEHGGQPEPFIVPAAAGTLLAFKITGDPNVPSGRLTFATEVPHSVAGWECAQRIVPRTDAGAAAAGAAAAAVVEVKVSGGSGVHGSAAAGRADGVAAGGVARGSVGSGPIRWGSVVEAAEGEMGAEGGRELRSRLHHIQMNVNMPVAGERLSWVGVHWRPFWGTVAFLLRDANERNKATITVDMQGWEITWHALLGVLQ